MNIDFSNQTVIITGASRGIGKDIATHFAKKNAKTVIISRDSLTLNNVAQELSEFNDYIMPIALDVSNLNSFNDAVKSIEKKFNTIDILINNAGITRDNLILRLKEEDWDKVININLKGCFNGMKAVSKNMIKNKKGKIINISSIIGLTGNVGQSNYAASKAGIIGLTKSLAKEVGSRNINVNAIAPGYIETDMTDSLNDQSKQDFLNSIPLKRFGKTEEVANLVCFLCSNLSNYITGQVINIDGGLD